VAIGELWGPLDRWIKYYGNSGDELHLPFNFRLMDESIWSATVMHALVDAMQAALPEFAWPNYVLGNHDRMRLATRFGGQAQARLAAMMLLTLRGTPTLYYGDELGIENGIIPPEKIQDPQGINLGPERSRDVCRTPMQWDASQYAGFSLVEPWLPVSDDYAIRNVEEMADDPYSILNLYMALLFLRKRSQAIQVGDYKPLDILSESCFIYQRITESECMLVALNFTGETQNFSLTDFGITTCLLSTHLDRLGGINSNDIQLRPYEGLIIQI
jgi:alpha-glucosidase